MKANPGSKHFWKFYRCDKSSLTLEGWKMAVTLKNIKAESEKVGYNPETGTNWCHLPNKIKEKCIKEMDFKTRTRIRAASRIEKSYVDADIYQFDKAIFCDFAGPDRHFFRPDITNPLMFLKRNPLSRGGLEKIGLTLDCIPPFKFCVFQELHCIVNSCYQRYLNKWVAECGPFQFKSLRCKGGNFGIVPIFLKNSWDGVEEIYLDIERREDFSIDSIFCPAFLKAKRVFIENVPFCAIELFADKIYKEWINNDSKIGTIYRLHTGKFGERITNSIKKRVAVRIANSTKSREMLSTIRCYTYDPPAADIIIKIF